MGGFFGGSSSTTVVNQTSAPTEEEKELIKLNAEIARRQLGALDQIQPFQKELLDLSIADLRREGQSAAAFDKAITPEEQAAFAKEDFERTRRLGPVQDELLTLQLESLRRGGAATPEQEAQIREAADAGIFAGSADIDIATQRGIGLIEDELANSRRLRLSDSPIASEAALLAREGQAQKGSLIENLRAAEATAKRQS